MPHLRAHEVQQLLHNKFVVVLGDSIQRAVYKDLVLLLQKDCLLSSSQLKSKGELSFEHDVLLEGGRWGRMHNGAHYREVRQFCSGRHLVRFYFLTRAYSPYVEDILQQLRWGEYAPDLVIVNSCLWDLSRYRSNFLRNYREDLERLFQRLDQLLPSGCLVVWNTTMPVAEVVSGGFILPDASGCPSRLREDVMEANFYSSVEAARHGFDVLDLHFHFRHAGQHRLSDGVHWDERAHRYLSQLLLAHVADAWGVILPAHNTVGRWIRDVPAERQPDRADRRQPRDHHHCEQREPPGARHSPSSRYHHHHTPQRSSSHPRNLPSRREDRIPSSPTSQPQPFHRDSSRRRHGYSREVNSVDREHRPGPIRRVYSHHEIRASSPYPSRHHSEPHRSHRRHSHHRHT
ncbi:PC-esterase domain-containing protein 1B-like [Rattus norvegicus]|uniref:PC-esterase domain containing 1B like 1 n=1 Tax=Rattus norvegicus TaxID=10116 RepID=F1M6L4_RAT|nr:PC-esterase domain-containing protein 1B-like [Rattus norvegicus]|eukprot:XP_237227.3 PREDICTED: PC-esterase domain-containing protein 1B-like [Rattus norvegicus]